MSFRVVTIPLRERTKNEAKLGELIVDNNYGDISVLNSIDFNKDETLVKHENKESSTKKIEGELHSIKIRRDLIEESLQNDLDTLGTYTIPKDFNILTDREDNILASIRYINETYDKYIKENVVSKFNIPSIIDNIYSKDNQNSYYNIFRNILYNLLEGTDTNEIKSTSFSEIIKKILMSFENESSKGLLYDLDKAIRELNELNDLLDSKINFNKDSKEEIYNTIRNFLDVKDIIRSKKFIRYNDEIFEENSKIPPNMENGTKIQTENEIGENFNKEPYLAYYIEQKEDTNNSNVYNNNIEKDYEFTDHFIANPLSNNFDGDNNLYMLDSIYYVDNYKDSSLFINNDSKLIEYNLSTMINCHDYTSSDSRLPMEYLDTTKSPKPFGLYLDNRFTLNRGFSKNTRENKVFMYSNTDDMNLFHRVMNDDLINGIILTYMSKFNGLLLYSSVYSSNLSDRIETNPTDFSTYRYLKNRHIFTTIQLGYTTDNINPIFEDNNIEEEYKTYDMSLYNILQNNLKNNIDIYFTKYPNYLVNYIFNREPLENENDTKEIENSDKYIALNNFILSHSSKDLLFKNQKDNEDYNNYSAVFNYYRGRSFLNGKTNTPLIEDMDIISYNKSFLNYFELYLKTFDNLFNGEDNFVNDTSVYKYFDFKNISDFNYGLSFKDENGNEINGIKLLRYETNNNLLKGGYFKIVDRVDNNPSHALFDYTRFEEDKKAKNDNNSLSIEYEKPTWKDTMKRFILNNLGMFDIPNYNSTINNTLKNALDNFEISVDIKLNNKESFSNSLLNITDVENLY